MVHRQKAQYQLSKATFSKHFTHFGHPAQYAEVPKLCLELAPLMGD